MWNRLDLASVTDRESRTTSYAYDADGNLINDGQHAYAWDAANRLVKVTNLKSGNVTTYGYDGLGHRDVIGTQAAGGASTETIYLWCGNTLCGARNSNNQVTADYYPQGEQHDRYTPAGTRDASNLYYAKDQIGSIVGVMNARGDLHGSTEYTAYGAVRKTAGARADFGYAGMFYDATTGLYLTKYREYMPTAGRWLSRDPIGIAGGQNIYAYVDGNPLEYYDRDGNDPVSALIGAGIGAIWGGVNGYLSGDRGWQLVGDAASDAAIGGLAGLTDGASLLGSMGTRAVLSAGIESVHQIAKGLSPCHSLQDISYVDIGAAAAGSLLGDTAGGNLENAGMGDRASTAIGGLAGGSAAWPNSMVEGANAGNGP